jgi:parallel beta-helix repeat protein
MENIKRILILMSFCMVLALFMGVVSAASLNLTETELASEGVKNYTEAHGNIPGYVEVSDKNSSAASFLKTVTKTTVQLNSGSTAPVNISSVNSPTGPSGSATGNLYKADYVTVANNVYNYINTNGRAPNYASSSLGNIRYESLVYTYSKVVNFYQDNGYLPNYVSVVYYTGVDSTGVVIDNVPPSISNNLASGSYNTTKSVTLTATDSHDPNPKVYYSTNNGSTWNNQANSITLSLSQGITTLKYYARDTAGNQGTTQTATYTIDTTAPTATANLPGGIYNTTKSVTLTATDNLDTNPLIYYSLNNGSTWNNQANSVTLSLGQGVTTLKYYARDTAGNTGPTQTETYTIDTTAPTIIESDPANGEINVSEDKIITITFNKPIQAGSLWIELKNNAGTAVPFTTLINGSVLTITPTNFLTADKYTLTLHTGSVTDLAGNPLALCGINFNTTSLFTIDSITNAAGTVKSYIETHHSLPSSVNISGVQVSMAQFLELLATATININNNSNVAIPIGSYDTAPSPSENITRREIDKTEYLDIAGRVKSYMDTYGRAPNYATQTSTGSTIRYESLVYMYSQILNSYNLNGALPNNVTVEPWANVSSYVIGNTSYGYVEKEFYGNPNSNQTIVIIIGVHPQENGIHTAIYNAIINKSSDLSKRYVLYYVHVTQDADDYSQGRMNGQLLAQEFIVPDVASENPILVLDCHENHGADSGYTYYRFLYLISNTTTTTNYASDIISQIPSLVTYSPPNPTSTQYVTVPIANQGITTMIYETYFYDSVDEKTSDANAMIDALDTLDQNTTEPTTPTVTANPTGSSFNTSKTVTLTNTNPNSTATIYYTTDGSNPQTSSTQIEYTTPVVLNNTTTLKFSAVDSNNNWSPIYSETYTLDTTAPTVASVDPANGTVKVPSDKVIKVTFSEPIKAGSLWIELKNNAGTAIPFTTFISSKVLTITPTTLLTANKYTLTLHTGSVTDLAGNSLALWGTNFNTTNAFTIDSITNAAGTVKNYVETHHALPSSVTISGTQISMPQFLKLATEALLNIAGTLNTSLIPGTYGSAPSPSETMTSGIINSTEYKDIAKRVNSFMNSNGRAPNYVSSSLGNIRYESIIYICSEILDSYNTNYVLPYLIITDPWSVVSNTNTVFYSIDQIDDAAGRVKSFVESNHRLPSYVTISNKQVDMPSFLRMVATTLLNIDSYSNAATIFKSYDPALNPEETITSKNMNMSEYIDFACRIKTFMDDPNYNRAPNYLIASFGNIRFESLVYMYSKLLDYHNSTGYLPQNVTVDPWSIVSNSNTVFFTADQINSAAGTVKSYIETNHALPSSVTIAGKQVTMPQFLQLSTESLLTMQGILCTSFIPRNYGTATTPSENVTSEDMDYTEYLDIAKRVNSFMDSNGRAPNYATQSSTGNTIRYESLVYIYAQILNSYTNINGTLPNYITINPWSIVSNSNTVFLNIDQINNASGTVKSYIELNHALPNSVTIAGKQISMSQFLKLATTALLNMDGYLNTSIVLGSVGNATNSTEDIVSGDMTYDEYMAIAQYTKSYMDSNGTAPNYAYQTSLGTHMGFQSQVYMYAQILNFYKTNNETLPSYLTITPWIAVSNPNAVYNYQSNKIFNSVQEAIDDNDTVSGTTIGIGKAIVSENIVVNKGIQIMSTPTVKVTVQAANPNLPVFTITTDGSGSIIQDLIIRGSTNNAGIYINGSYYNIISNNIISNNSNGVYIYNSTDNHILDSDILNNTANGIFIDTCSNNNTINGNNLINNSIDGISINSSNDNTISGNIISNNNRDGIYLNNSSAHINFNRIVSNNRYGLYKTGNGTVDATNNWWGSNNPVVSSVSGSDIYVPGGNVTYDPWLVLNLTSSCDRSDRNGTTYNYTITADLTHNNHGEDTYNNNGSSNGNSSDNTLPDDIPINFSTTFGTISTTVSTRNGKAVATLNSTAAGSANVTATLDNQTIATTVNITNVTALGITNTRTGESFATIQAAIDSNNTLDGDTITLADGTYTENVVVYKKITIKPVSGSNVTVQAADPNNSIFTIVENGSTIQNLNIVGAVSSYGILSYVNNVNITGNTITANNNGITLFNSNGAIISGNTIINNMYGITIYNSISTTISGNNIVNNWYGSSFYNSTSALSENNITGNWYGVFINTADNIMLSGNNITDNNIGISLFNSTSTTILGNNITNNQVGISYYESTSTTTSGNTITNNSIADIQQIDTTGVVIQGNIWDCGPASLATVLNKMGINVTQDELASLAATDESGTSMYGLVHAAQSKGLNAIGMLLSVDQLKPNYIVLLITANGLHYSVITRITNDTVYLADSSFGNINMTLEDFTAIYSGYALIITNNSTNNSTNNTINGTLLTNEQMQNIKGTDVVTSVFGGAIAIGEIGIGTLCAGAAAVFGIGVIFAQPVGVGEDAYWDNWRRTHTKHNTIYVGSGGYSYSYRHGYNPRSTPPRHIPYIPPTYTYSLYVATPTGWEYKTFTTTSNPAILKDQQIYKQYQIKKASELAKIAGLAEFYLGMNSKQKQNVIHVPPQFKNAVPPKVPDGPKGDKSEFIRNYYKEAKKDIMSGKDKIMNGDPIGGMWDVAKGIGKLYYLASYLIHDFTPEGIWPK